MGLVNTADRFHLLNEKYISKSKSVKKNLFEEFFESDSFNVGQSVGVMINNDKLYTFINGVNIDVESGSFVGGRLSGVINIAGRYLKVKIELLHKTGE